MGLTQVRRPIEIIWAVTVQRPLKRQRERKKSGAAGNRTQGLWLNPLNANDAKRRHRIRKRVSANDAFRRHRLARAIRVAFLYLRASERNVTLRAPVAVVGPSHSYLIVSSGRTRGAQSTAALCAKFHAVLLD